MLNILVSMEIIFTQLPASSFQHKLFDVSYKHTGLPSRTTCHLLKLYCCATCTSANTACLVPQYGSDRLALNGRMIMIRVSPPTSSSSRKGMIINNSCEFFGMRTQIHKEVPGQFNAIYVDYTDWGTNCQKSGIAAFDSMWLSNITNHDIEICLCHMCIVYDTWCKTAAYCIRFHMIKRMILSLMIVCLQETHHVLSISRLDWKLETKPRTPWSQHITSESSNTLQ